MNVAKLNNDPKAIQAAVNLMAEPQMVRLGLVSDKTGAVLPLSDEMFGRNRAVIYNRMVTRADGSRKPQVQVLDVGTGQHFKPHRNADILEAMCTAASSAGMVLGDVRTLYGGRDIIAKATLNGKSKAEAVKGDVLSGEVVIYASHRIGAAVRYWTQVLRLVCGNGMTRAERGQTVRVTHRQALAPSQEQMNALAQQLAASMGKWTEDLGRMAATPMTPTQTRAYLMSVTAPELLEAVVDETAARRRVAAGRDVVGRPVLAEMLEAVEESVHVQNVLLKGWETKKRSLGRLLDAIVSQPGHEYAPGTVYSAYNAVTWAVDHLRETDASQESAMLGEGRMRKERALDVGLEYVEAVQQLRGVA